MPGPSAAGVMHEAAGQRETASRAAARGQPVGDVGGRPAIMAGADSSWTPSPSTWTDTTSPGRTTSPGLQPRRDLVPPPGRRTPGRGRPGQAVPDRPAPGRPPLPAPNRTSVKGCFHSCHPVEGSAASGYSSLGSLTHASSPTLVPQRHPPSCWHHPSHKKRPGPHRRNKQLKTCLPAQSTGASIVLSVIRLKGAARHLPGTAHSHRRRRLILASLMPLSRLRISPASSSAPSPSTTPGAKSTARPTTPPSTSSSSPPICQRANADSKSSGYVIILNIERRGQMFAAAYSRRGAIYINRYMIPLSSRLAE